MAYKLVDSDWCSCVSDYRKEYIVDTEADIANLPQCCAGSSALVVESGDVFIVNASGEWKTLPNGIVTKEYLDKYMGEALGGDY